MWHVYPPQTGGPYTLSSIEIELFNGIVILNTIATGLTIMGNTYCATIETSSFGAPTGSFEVRIFATFTMQNAPFTGYQVIATSTNPGQNNDIFFGNCPIDATNDYLNYSSCAGPTSFSPLVNDTFMGVTATTNNVTITQTSPQIPGITLNTSTGVVTTAQGLANGTYPITYQICNRYNSAQCDTATCTVVISNPTIITVNDAFNVNLCAGNVTPSVIANDSSCGNILDPLQYTISLVPPISVSGTSINSSGNITIPPGTPPGTYSFIYKVCSIAMPAQCANGTASVTVGNNGIVAGNDSATINTLIGGNTASVLLNDTLSGATATSASVSTTIIDYGGLSSVNTSMDSNGVITLQPGIAIGTYVLTYQISEIGCTNNTTTATMTITVNEVTIGTPPIAPGSRANNVVSLSDTQGDGKIIIGGYFTKYQGANRIGIARLNTNLTLDTTSPFVSTGSTPANYIPLDMKVYKNSGPNFNKIILVGKFQGFNGGSNGNGIVRLNPNGSVDTSFNSAYTNTLDKGFTGVNAQARVCYIYPDGRILVGGMFDKYNGVDAHKLVRLNADGTLDTAFSANINAITLPGPQATPGFNSSPDAIAVDSQGNILVGGFFTMFNGEDTRGLLRLLPNGTRDASFNDNSAFQPPIGGGGNRGLNRGFIKDILIQPDGKIIIAGYFNRWNATNRNHIARLKSNGSIDESFNPGSGFAPVLNTSGFDIEPPGMIRDIEFEPGSTLKIYACGNFTTYSGSPVQRVIRINSGTTGGTKDSQFFFGDPSNSTHGPNDNVWTITKQGDGKMILGGEFTKFILPLQTTSAEFVTRVMPATNSPTGELRGNIVKSGYEEENLKQIDTYQDADVELYPNPSSGFVTLHIPKHLVNSAVTIFNALGQKLTETQVKESTVLLNLADLPSGHYFIVIQNTDNIIKKALILN